MRYFLIIYFLTSATAFAQSGQSISGYVRDASTGEDLIGAHIQVNGMNIGVSTNSYGFFSLNVPDKKFSLTISFIGYQPLIIDVDTKNRTQFVFELTSLDNVLEEVVVLVKKRNNYVTNPQMGFFNFTMEEVKNVPTFLGEKDILKVIQTLPGISKGGEGATSFYVRGGAGDQNLVLLDEATVYNASHLLGFFSSFNSDAIKDVGLYKEGIPAQYGGRISSVMDVKMLDGNNKKFGVEGGIGLIASRLKLEGPIVKDKSSFMLSGRRTYADMLLKLSNNNEVSNSKLYFYDLNAKFNYRFNDKNTLYVSGYFGKDDMAYTNLFRFNWGNKTGTLRWNHIFNERLFSNTTFAYSDFGYNGNVNSTYDKFSIASNIENINLKQDFSFYANNNNTIKFGFNVFNQKISPSTIDEDENTGTNSRDVEKRYGTNVAGYVSHEWKPVSWYSMVYGIRIADYMVNGPGTFYTFDANGNRMAEKTYNGGVIKHYFNLEPRLSLSVLLNESNSFKASYNRLVQNIHQLNSTISSLPTDQYIMTSINVKPQIADQVALGYFGNFANNKYEFSLETYYKKMDNQIDIREGTNVQVNQYLEGTLVYGDGRSYGVEFYLRKNQGKFKGWISYSLGKSERKFAEINDGEWFKSRQDRTHDFSIVGLYNLSPKWTFSANFVYYTGNPVTYPSGNYIVNGDKVFYFSKRNEKRMPNYHRLDISATYEPKNRNKKFNSSWTFGLYNLYNKKNPFLIDFRNNQPDPSIIDDYKISLFGIVPSISWNFNF